MSEVGVITADTTKMISTAQRKLRIRKRGVDQADLAEQHEQHRQLEHQAEPEHDGEQEAVVALGGDHRLEVGPGDLEQEAHGHREGDEVGEGAAQHEEEPAEKTNGPAQRRSLA